MALFQVIIGGLLLLVGGFITTMNWGVLFRWVWRRKHSSWIPMVGGSLAAAGVALMPYAQVNTLWWVPLFLDWGCLPGLAVTFVFYIWRLFTKEAKTMN
jgi:hypothetical protein